VASSETAIEAEQRSDTTPAPPVGRLAGRLLDLLAVAVYLALARYLSSGYWADPNRRVATFLDGADEILMQWFLAHSAHAVAHLDNPFFTTAMGAPRGVDLAAEVSLVGLGIPLAPLTLLAGVGVTTCVVITGTMVATAAAWYWLLSHPLGLNRGAAMVGGLFCGFAAPLAVDDSRGHSHVNTQFVIPLILWWVVRIARGTRPVRDGLILGALVAYQALIGEEVLLITALAMAVFLLAYAVQRREQARAALPYLLRGLAVAVLVTGVLLAVPLWYQFAGPQHYPGNPQSPLPFGSTVMDYLGISAKSPWWSSAGGWGLAIPALGLPIVLVLLAFGWPLRRDAVFTSGLVAGVVMALLSLSVQIKLRERVLPVPGPWRLFAHLPVFQWVIPSRLGLAVVPAAGLAIAYILNRALTRWRAGIRWVPAATVLAVAGALIAVAPDRFPTLTLPASPHFVTSGAWRPYVPAGRSLVTVPAPNLQSFDGMRWAAASNGDIVIPGGYFIGPSEDGTRTTFGPAYTWTTLMWNQVDSTGEVWKVSPGDRDRLLRDLRYWKASVVVVVPTRPHSDALRASVEELLGPPQQVDDVLLWNVRSLV
jgi:hypothetical protein